MAPLAPESTNQELKAQGQSTSPLKHADIGESERCFCPETFRVQTCENSCPSEGGPYTFAGSVSGSNPFCTAGCSLGVSQSGGPLRGSSMQGFHIHLFCRGSPSLRNLHHSN